MPKIEKRILQAEGPNGEDIEQTINSETKEVLKTRVLSHDESEHISRQNPEWRQPKLSNNGDDEGVGSEEESEHGDDNGEAPLMSAAEMMQLAISQRNPLMTEEHIAAVTKAIIEECAKNPLEGYCAYLLEDADKMGADGTRAVLSKLRELGYTARRVTDPEQGVIIEVKWPTREKQKRRRRRQARAEQTIAQLATASATQTLPKIVLPKRNKPGRPTNEELEQRKALKAQILQQMLQGASPKKRGRPKGSKNKKTAKTVAHKVLTRPTTPPGEMSFSFPKEKSAPKKG